MRLTSHLLACPLILAAGQDAMGDERQSEVAETLQVELELVLLADASGSIDEAEIAFQRQGYIEAIQSPDVLAAISGTGRGRIALTYVEWADQFSQDIVAPWMVIETSEDAALFAAQLETAPRQAYGRNAIGAALVAGRDFITGNAIASRRQVIDFSADSANNWNGPSIEEGRRAALDAGITINGLAVLCRFCSGRPVSYDLEAAFAEQIIGGPGAFVITADSAETFADAVRRKLVREIAGAPGAAPTARLALVTDTCPDAMSRIASGALGRSSCQTTNSDSLSKRPTGR